MVVNEMKNKNAKRMICKIRDEKEAQFLPYFGFYFTREGLNECYPCGSGPDNYYEDSEVVNQGVVSLTADQLRGK